MGNNLKALRKSQKLTHDQAAEAMGVSRGQFIKLERGERRLTADYIARAARAFGVPEAAVIETPDPIPLVGFVGAGAEAVFFGEGDPLQDEVAPPVAGSTPDTVAVEIRGGSLGSLFDRWICYYDDRHDPPTQEMLRKLCIVGLEDGRVLVKQLNPGSVKGLFDLWSNNEAPIRDVAVAWAAIVTAIRPR